MPAQWEWIVTEPSGRVRKLIAATKTSAIEAISIVECIPVDFIRDHFRIERGDTIDQSRNRKRIEELRANRDHPIRKPGR